LVDPAEDIATGGGRRTPLRQHVFGQELLRPAHAERSIRVVEDASGRHPDPVAATQISQRLLLPRQSEGVNDHTP
jgi:hypothetical protein